MRLALTLSLIALSLGCAARPASVSGDLVFLTRGGCANTTQMRAHLDQALTAMGQPQSYQVLELETLPSSDLRRGYPTPTLLYQGRDVFDLPEPAPPLPDPT
jgi:hypothetical protein